MTESAADPLDLRLKAWGQTEIEQTTVRWTPAFLRMKASLTLRERHQNRAATLEHTGWIIAVAAALLGLLVAWPARGWSLMLESPTVFLPAVFSLGLLGRSIWASLEA